MANPWFETVAIAQQRAKKRLPASSYGAIVAGAEAGVTMCDNPSAFDELGFRPVTGPINIGEQGATLRMQPVDLNGNPVTPTIGWTVAGIGGSNAVPNISHL